MDGVSKESCADYDYRNARARVALQCGEFRIPPIRIGWIASEEGDEGRKKPGFLTTKMDMALWDVWPHKKNYCTHLLFRDGIGNNVLLVLYGRRGTDSSANIKQVYTFPTA